MGTRWVGWRTKRVGRAHRERISLAFLFLGDDRRGSLFLLLFPLSGGQWG